MKEPQSRSLTTDDISRLLQVDRGSVARWADLGHLRSYRTPGGHRRILPDDLRDFVRRFRMHVHQDLGVVPSVLFVDDDARSKVLVQAFRRLVRQAAQVRHVCSGVDALVEVGRQVPDLIVLAIFMPGLDGLEVCRRLRQNPVTRAVRVVAMSASDDPLLERQVLEAGAEMLLRKPVQARQLVPLIGPGRGRVR